MSDPLQSHGLQHTKLPCPSLSPWVCSNSYPLSQWCYPTISSSVTPFFSCPQSFPESGSFPMTRLFTSEWSRQNVYRTSVVAQWIRICLSMQETQVWSLIWEDCTRKSNSVTIAEPLLCNLCSAAREATTVWSPHTTRKSRPCLLQLEKAQSSQI